MESEIMKKAGKVKGEVLGIQKRPIATRLASHIASYTLVDMNI
jgi:hypothetical protein